jgi:hypothetical protein
MRFAGLHALVMLLVAASSVHAITVAKVPTAANGLMMTIQGSPQQLEQRLRKVIGELQSGQPDLNDMEPLLKITVQQQLPNVTARLKSLGSVTAVQYVGPQNNAEVFQVTFQQGMTAWMIQTAPNGKLSALWFN